MYFFDDPDYLGIASFFRGGPDWPNGDCRGTPDGFWTLLGCLGHSGDAPGGAWCRPVRRGEWLADQNYALHSR